MAYQAGKNATVTIGTTTYAARSYRSTESVNLVEVSNTESAGNVERIVAMKDFQADITLVVRDTDTFPVAGDEVTVTLSPGHSKTCYVESVEYNVDATGEVELRLRVAQK